MEKLNGVLDVWGLCITSWDVTGWFENDSDRVITVPRVTANRQRREGLLLCSRPFQGSVEL